jgi:hypothetical protein
MRSLSSCLGEEIGVPHGMHTMVQVWKLDVGLQSVAAHRMKHYHFDIMQKTAEKTMIDNR